MGSNSEFGWQMCCFSLSQRIAPSYMQALAGENTALVPQQKEGRTTHVELWSQ